MKYVSEEKNIKSGSEAIKRKPYTYAESMYFFKHCSKKKEVSQHI